MFMDGKLAFQAAYGHMFAGGYIQENLGIQHQSALGLCPALDELLSRSANIWRES